MKQAKRQRLELKGWKIGSPKEFLGLSEEEAVYVELKLALSTALRNLRTKSTLTQTQLASLIDSSQSRVAKMESGDPSVSIDLIIKALVALGATRSQIAKALAARAA
jgi:DNA-binding XRE family transcriptional regulator